MNCIIEKGIKDRQHPFVQVARSLIDDREASIGLRMLIITCLSKPDSWKHNVTNMADCLGVCSDTIYNYLNEGIQLGYITRTQEKIKGKFSSGSYKIFEEKQEIQKILPIRKKPDTVLPDTEIPTHSNKGTLETNSSNERIACAKEPKISTEKCPEEPIENVQNHKTKFSNRKIPHFLKQFGAIEKDHQILANQFSDSEILRALEDARSYHKNKQPIKNLAAFITQRCKDYKQKGCKRA